MRIVLAASVCAALSIAVPGIVIAQDRDYCPIRPGLGTTPCTISAGRVSVESEFADWERDDTQDGRTDTLLIGDTVVRIGLTDSVEAIVGFTPYGHVRTRDTATGTIQRRDRVGDLTLGFKSNVANPDGNGLSFAVQPFVTLPIGRTPVGAGDWGGGILAPVTYDLTDSINLQFTPEIDAAVDQDARGRHLAYSGVVGVDYKLSDSVDLVGELEALRDRDPAGRATQAFAALAIEWQPNDDIQLDLGGVAGLHRDTPDARIYAGVSRRF